MINRIVQILLLAASSQAMDVTDGLCPFRPGEIKSKMRDTLDVTKIQGPWITYFDERELTNRFLCMSAKFMLYDDSKDNELSFQQANSIYEQTREHLREVGETDADQRYFINSGRRAVFDHPDDKSVATMKQTYVQVNEQLDQPEDPEVFNEHKFEQQFQTYVQILDTDYSGYLLVYSCQESAEWTDASGNEVYPEDVFKASINQREFYGHDEPSSLYFPENFANLKGIKREYIHKQKIQIYTRPKLIPDTKEYKFQSFNKVQLSQLEDDISNVYLKGQFSENVLDTFYAKMVHDGTCDYNPYDNLEYYNIHHDHEETKEELINQIQTRKDEELAKEIQGKTEEL